MTNPPNRVGGVRGPNGTTLDQLYDQLSVLTNAISGLIAPLNNIDSQTAQIASDLRRISGEAPLPQGWAGLPGAIGVDFINNGASVIDYLSFVEQQLLIIWRALQPGTTPTLTTILAVLTAMQGSPATNLSQLANLLASIDAEVLEVSNVLGSTANPPVGSTIKDLLRSIDTNVLRSAVCCEEGGGTGGDPLNEPPAELCTAAQGYSTPIRVQDWVQLSTAGGLTYYGAQFPVSTPPPFMQHINDDDPNRDWTGLAPDPGGGVAPFICFTWNFTGATVTSAQAQVTRAAVTSWYFGGSSSVVNPFNPTGGAYADATELGFALGFQVATPEGSGPPARNVWVATSAQE